MTLSFHPSSTCVVVLALFLSLSAGCRSDEPAQREPAPPAPRVTQAQPSGRVTVEGNVGRFVSTPWSFSTASYWIEGEDGLILVDAQFLPSMAEAFVDVAEATTGKKAKLAIVLHPNPDKFNGTKALQARGIRVVTSEQVSALIAGVHEKRLRAFYDRYQPDYPRELPAPESFGVETTELSAGGVTVRAHVLGAGCSEAHVVVEYEGHLFPGDLVAHEAHSWLEIGRTDAWLERLDELRALGPRRVHPGRGASGGPELLDEEEAYLRAVMAAVAEEQPALPVDKAALARVRQKLEAAYPRHAFPVFLRIGLPAEWERQARSRAPATE